MIEIKTWKQILASMISVVTGGTDQLTDFNEGSPLRELLGASAVEIQRCWVKLYSLYHSAFLDSATGEDLDRIVALLGLTRFDENAASGWLRFYGTEGSTVTLGSQVSSEDGIVYQTTTEYTIGVGETYVDVPAVCLTTGALGNKGRGEITQLLQAIPGITSVTNLAAFTGGRSAETDAELRDRARARISVLAISTADSYEQLALFAANSFCFDDSGDPWVRIPCDGSTPQAHLLRAKAEPRWNGRGTVKVHLVGTEAESIPAGLQSFVEDFIQERVNITTEVTVAPATFVQVDVTCIITPRIGYTEEQVRQNVEAALAAYLDWTTWEWGQEVLRSDLISVIEGTEGVYDVDITTPNSNVQLGTCELPRFGTLTVTYWREAVTGEETA